MKASIERREIVIRIPLPDNYTKCPLSANGGSYVISSTSGWQWLPGSEPPMKMSLAVITSAKALREVREAAAERVAAHTAPEVAPETPQEPVTELRKKNPLRVEAGRRGGVARNQNTTFEQRQEYGRMGAAARYGLAPKKVREPKVQEPLRASLLDLLRKGP